MPPEVNARGTFTLSYKGKDDYGIASLDGIVEKADNSKGRSLVPAPQLTLALPSHEENAPDTKSPVDLTNHAWAGAPVTIRLKAKDEAGQEATSEAINFTLPQRPFTNPLAKALVEQRRKLVLAPDDRKRVQVALDALLIAPESYTPQWGVFMGLRAGTERLRVARTRPGPARRGRLALGHGAADRGRRPLRRGTRAARRPGPPEGGHGPGRHG